MCQQLLSSRSSRRAISITSIGSCAGHALMCKINRRTEAETWSCNHVLLPHWLLRFILFDSLNCQDPYKPLGGFVAITSTLQIPTFSFISLLVAVKSNDIPPWEFLAIRKGKLVPPCQHGEYLIKCDPLCENPAKVNFLWFTVFYINSSFIWKRTFCENVTFISLILTE